MKTLNREQTIEINEGIDCDDAINVFFRKSYTYKLESRHERLLIM